MVNDLRDLLRDAAQNPPDDGVVPHDLLVAGKTRVRRRRLGTLAGGAALVVAIAAIPFGFSRLDLGRGEAGVANQVQPVGKVMALKDAVGAVEGEDYDVLFTQLNQDLDEANGTYVKAIVAGGVLTADGPRGADNVIRWGLLDPERGTTDWLPLTETNWGPDRFVGQTSSGRLVFVDNVSQALWTVHTEDEMWVRTELETPVGLTVDNTWSIRLGEDDRVYVAIDESGRSESFRLVSAALDDLASWREEGTVGDFTFMDGKLVYTAHTNRPDSTIHVHDLTTGDERTFNSQAGRTCNQLWLAHAGDLVVSSQYCGTRDGVRDDRIQVFGLDGEPVVTIQDSGVDLVDLTDEFLVVQAYRRGAAGYYAYELATGRFLRLSEGHVKFCCLSASSGRTLGWARPVNNGRGAEIVLADLR